MSVDFPLPCNLDAECFVLGSAMVDGELFNDVVAVLTGNDFSLEKHRRIFARMKEMYDRGETIDRVTLANELKRMGQLESVDGLSYLVSLDAGLPTLRNIDSYIRIVKEKAILRETIFACQGVIERCAQASGDSREILESADAILTRVRNNGVSRSQWVTPYQVLVENPSLLHPSPQDVGLATPWPKLTEMTSGWAAGDLVIVAGRTSMGKTVIGMQQAMTTASKGGGVAYISLEMSKGQLVLRLIAGMSRVDSHKSRWGHITQEERRRRGEAAADLENVPIYIDDSRSHTPAAVSTAIRKLRAKTPISLVVIDHLQLMKVSGRSESRHQELAEICHGFKRMAGELECAVMVLSQLNRSCEQERRRPNLSDLKECGAIEEDADSVLFIHRPEMYKRDDPSLRGHAELIVAKQRNGPIGKIALTFLHGFQIFEEATREVEDAL